MQPVGAPIGRHVRAVAPDGADLLAADRLPDVLSVLDGGAVEQDAAVGGDDLDGIGGALLRILMPTPPNTAKETVSTNPSAIHSFL